MQLIKEPNNGEWTNKWGAFIDAHQKADPQGIWKISDWKNKKAQRSNVPQEFKTNCSNNGSKQVVDKKEGIYQKVKSYCTKPLPATPTKR
ncbi:hypothetical protein A6V39_01150 [Candidatus Mycoplasma haematobovis]|uniref:Uncharacterized protein n=1 Tax=Candidatus Mycoplasma haematobovis TaxID=432608 RepID=A0A1A9QG24_9MOLU|nr:hypothetical protein [Candidatus Mycoplasma haematobovis]OAL10660.1 hypothetical protein A6V39_01150 [Candidatus Mycoplasma haematobovis]